MRPKHLIPQLVKLIKAKEPTLIVGPPGVGKTMCMIKACNLAGFDWIILHPVVSDPTDFKGLPAMVKINGNGDAEAVFLPIGELKRLVNADKPLVCFIDDLGQATVAVQAAAMQLLLARRIGDHKISDEVTFLAATNRREDRAGVQGILEPVKSRFTTIISFDVSDADWIDWAMSPEEGNMPMILVNFIRFFGIKMLFKFTPTRDLVNSPNPRTVAAVGRMIRDDLTLRETEYETWQGAAGEEFAAKLRGYIKYYRDLGDIDEKIKNPEAAEIPENPESLWAFCGAIAERCSKKNFANVIVLANRMEGDFSTLLVKDCVIRHTDLTQHKAFIAWAELHNELLDDFAETQE